jgi:hypothetical protein
MTNDSRWDEVTAGRVFPKTTPVEPRRSPVATHQIRFAEALVKPSAYKAINEVNR